MPGRFNVPGDIGISDDGARLNLAAGVELAKQSLESEGVTAVETYDFDLNHGLPLFELLAAATDDIARIIFSDWLEVQPVVESVTSVAVTRDRTTRKMTIAFSVSTGSGTVSDTYALGVT